jgi:cytidylate kinase
MIITLDGPTASGKSTIACALAYKLNGLYVSSGLFFRFLGFCAVQDGFTCEQLINLPDTHIKKYLNPEQFNYCYTNNCPAVIYNTCDITKELKSAPIDQAASCLGLNIHARQYVTEYQRALAERTPILVADGRDCGTHVFPQAEYKFFITAALEVRARRWQSDQKKHNHDFTLQESISSVQERDTRDSSRAHAPLVPASDAYTIDTTEFSVDQAVEQILAIIHNTQ